MDFFTLSLFSGLAVMTDPFMLFSNSCPTYSRYAQHPLPKIQSHQVSLFIKLGAVVCTGVWRGVWHVT
jgi:hypothetical protein